MPPNPLKLIQAAKTAAEKAKLVRLTEQFRMQEADRLSQLKRYPGQMPLKPTTQQLEDMLNAPPPSTRGTWHELDGLPPEPSNFAGGGHVGMEHTRSSSQDASTQPVDSQWRAALRSYLAGTAGLPGDIEGLARQGINAAFGLGGVKVDETPVMPTTEFYKDWLPGKQEGSAPLADVASMLGGAGMLKGIRSVESLGKAVGAAKALPDIGLARQAGVIRNTGDNNFLKGSVEAALKGLKKERQIANLQNIGRLPEADRAQLVQELGMVSNLPKDRVAAVRQMLYPEDVSLNKFVEGPLTRYVKQQMATPDDPVRALAEQGILHKDMTDAGYGLLSSLEDTRMAAKFPIEGVGKSDLARGWETNADMAISPAGTAKQILDDASTPFGSVLGKAWAKDNSWLQKAPPETKVFNPTPEMRDLGFDHLTDELRNALNPESGLPRNLLLTHEKMANMGMEKAVRHVAAINDWRAAQVAEANAQKANNAATVLYKEYPHTPETPNPKNLRWVELKAPPGKPLVKGEYQDPRFDIPEAEQTRIADRAHVEVRRANPRLNDETDDYMMAVEERMAELSQQYAAKNKPLLSKELQDALKYEGDTMKHCAGGYCDDVLSGKKRIFSLRDAKGEPHVTIHTEPANLNSGAVQMDPGYQEFAKSLAGMSNYEKEQALQEYARSQPFPERIVQIKRKANLVNSEPYEYRPFVQDFVKSGKWSDVGDLPNVGLRPTKEAFNTNELKKIRDAGHEVPEWASPDEINALGNAVWPNQWGKYGNDVGFATGGRVSMIHPAAAIQPLVRVPGFDRF